MLVFQLRETATPKLINYNVEIKTENELPESGFHGVVVRLIGTKDSSNPIAINGRFKGKHQCFVVQLANIGVIQKVFLDNIHDIQVAFD